MGYRLNGPKVEHSTDANIISDGNVLAAGVPEELSNNETVRKIYLGEEFDYPTTGKKQ